MATVHVRDVVGLTQAAATNVIIGQGLTIGVVTQQVNFTVLTGNVISQDPARGNEVAKGTPVNLVISLGQPVRLPNLVGETQTAATDFIVLHELSVGSITQETSYTVPPGSVISHDPAGPSVVAKGSLVNLVISSGPGAETVPDVVGMTQAAATLALYTAGFGVEITQQTSNTEPTGSVISQDPLGGSGLVHGSKVKLVLSSGPPMATVPDVVGLTEADATTAITGAQFTLGTVILQISPTDTVRSRHQPSSRRRNLRCPRHEGKSCGLVADGAASRPNHCRAADSIPPLQPRLVVRLPSSTPVLPPFKRE